MLGFRLVHSFIIFTTFLVFSFGNTFADDTAKDVKVDKTPAPEWIKPIKAEDYSDKITKEGNASLLFNLVDIQMKWLPSGYEFYYQYSYKVIDRLGLEQASRLTQNFDPSDTVMNFNSIRVIRDGVVNERLEGVEFSLLRQEGQLHNGIINGNMTALVELKDIRVGDIVEYSFSGVVTNKLWPGEFFDEFNVGFSEPVGQTYYRLVWPNDLPLYIKSYQDAPDPIKTGGEVTTEYVWDVRGSQAIPSEDGVPAWHKHYPYVTLSSMKEWSDVQQWAAPYYEVKSDVPKDFANKVKAIKKKWSKKEDRLTEALRLVQNEIRYVGIEIGLGSHIPRQPDEVVTSGYGDCKDKSLLLTYILKELGIDAWPALTNINAGVGLPEYQPSTQAFDHMIVKAKIKDKIYWLDATKSYQGGRGENIAPLYYGYALPVNSKNNGLEEIELPLPEVPTLDVVENFSFSDTNEEQFLTIDFIAVFSGDEADERRLIVAGQTGEQRDRAYLEHYQGIVKGIVASKPVEVSDDFDANILTISGSYSLSKKSAEEYNISSGITVPAYAVQGLFYQPNILERSSPMYLPVLVNRYHEINFITPGRRPTGLEDIEKDYNSVYFGRKRDNQGSKLSVKYTLRSNERIVQPENFGKVHTLIKTVSDNSSIAFTYDNVQLSLAGIFKVPEDDFAPYEEDFIKLFQAINNKDNISAIQELENLKRSYKKKDRIYGIINVVYGEVLKKMGRNASAREAFSQGIDYYPDDADSYFSLTNLYNNNEQYDEAARTLMKLVRNLPANINNLRAKWLGSLRRNLNKADQADVFNELAILLSKADFRGSEDLGALWVHLAAVKELTDRGEIDEARTILPKLKNTHILISLIQDKRYEELWPSLEEVSGKNFELSLQSDVGRLREEFEAAPEDYKKLTRYINALRAANMLDEAVKTAKPYMNDWQKIVATGEDAFWFVNEYAYTLHQMGNSKASIKVMDKIKALGLEDFPNSVSMVINQATILMEMGSFKKAIKAADAIDMEYTSTYGKMFIWATKACSLYGLKKEEEAEEAFAKLTENLDENERAYLGAVICKNDAVLAEKILVEHLSDEKKRSDILSYFLEPKDAKNIPSFLKKLYKRKSKIINREKVQKALIKVGRPLIVAGPTIYWGEI